MPWASPLWTIVSLTIKTHAMQKSSKTRIAKYLMFQHFNAQAMIIHLRVVVQMNTGGKATIMGIFILGALVLTICLAQRSTRWLPAKRQVAGTRVSPLLKSRSGWEWTWLEQDLSDEDKDKPPLSFLGSMVTHYTRECVIAE